MFLKKLKKFKVMWNLEWLTKFNYPIYKTSFKFIVYHCVVDYYIILNIVLKAYD
jgi:hypothetical protein